MIERRNIALPSLAMVALVVMALAMAGTATDEARATTVGLASSSSTISLWAAIATKVHRTEVAAEGEVPDRQQAKGGAAKA
mmetsp:Transcript_22065/g.45485  ORF Transcript_22065/g.45485 Transcript_22065/m.45485 type:complete len:81 (-) Transcript_22065:31-273(-)